MLNLLIINTYFLKRILTLGEILANFGIKVDEPNVLNIEKRLQFANQNSIKTAQKLPMVSIPIKGANSFVDREDRETVLKTDDRFKKYCVLRTKSQNLKYSLKQKTEFTARKLGQSTNVQLTQAESSSTMDEQLSFLSSTLSLSMLEAEFLQMHLKLFNLKASPISEPCQVNIRTV